MCSEFNFHADPEAAAIVLGQAHQTRCLLISWELTEQYSFDWSDMYSDQATEENTTLPQLILGPYRKMMSDEHSPLVLCDLLAACVAVNAKQVVKKSQKSKWRKKVRPSVRTRLSQRLETKCQFCGWC